MVTLAPCATLMTALSSVMTSPCAALMMLPDPVKVAVELAPSVTAAPEPDTLSPMPVRLTALLAVRISALLSPVR